MTWFFKMGSFCVTLILLGFTLDILGHTLYTCKRECKDQPDGHLCARWMSKVDGAENGKPYPRYQWLRNECEQKCFMMHNYNETVDMDFCTKDGQNHSTYRCDDYKMYKTNYPRCIRNEPTDF